MHIPSCKLAFSLSMSSLNLEKYIQERKTKLLADLDKEGFVNTSQKTAESVQDLDVCELTREIKWAHERPKAHAFYTRVWNWQSPRERVIALWRTYITRGFDPMYMLSFIKRK